MLKAMLIVLLLFNLLLIYCAINIASKADKRVTKK